LLTWKGVVKYAKTLSNIVYVEDADAELIISACTSCKLTLMDAISILEKKILGLYLKKVWGNLFISASVAFCTCGGLLEQKIDFKALSESVKNLKK